MTTNAEKEVDYAVSMHGHASERDAILALVEKVNRLHQALSLIEQIARNEAEHPATRCRSVAFLAQLGSYYAVGALGAVE